MEKSVENEVLGTLPEKDLELLKSNLNEINKIKFRVGELETAKYQALKEIDDLRYSLQVQEQKVVKRYGKDAVIDMKTGEIKAPVGTKRSLLSRLPWTK